MSPSALPGPDAPVTFGRYELVELVGEGAMAQVFRARRVGPSGFRKEVAIKRLRAGVGQDPSLREALVNEARNGGLLKHPGIVEVHEFDAVGDDWYLALEFVDGWTLDDVLWRSTSAGWPGLTTAGGLQPAVVVDIARQVADALAHVHEARDEDGVPLRLVHRDLKPANIFLSRRGQVKVGDFGLAKSRANLRQTTDADRTKGSPLYMSPEQVAGEPVDGRSDLFALGSCMVELLTGVTPFEGETVANTLVRVMEARWDARPLYAAAPSLAPLVTRLLQRDPAARYPSARALKQELDALAGFAPLGSGTAALAAAVARSAEVQTAVDEAPAGRTSVLASAVEGSGGSWALLAVLLVVLLVLMGAFLFVLRMPADREALVDLSAPEAEEIPAAAAATPAPLPSPVPAGVGASDDVLTHTPPAAARMWQDLDLVVQPTEKGWEPRVSYRSPGGSWRLQTLRCADVCQASLPVTADVGIEYWLEADGPEGARWTFGSAEHPIRVPVR